MQVLLVLVAAMLSPLLGLALLLWLAHLEDTLPRDVRRASRKPAPHRSWRSRCAHRPPTGAGDRPEQRAVPEVELAPTAAAVCRDRGTQTFSRSGARSLGGSTKR